MENKLIFFRKRIGIVLKTCIVCAMFCWSCQNQADQPEPLSDEIIAFNLSESGKIDPELLIGEWECVKFAYTADGKKISKTKHVSGNMLTIPAAPTSPTIGLEDYMLNLEDKWRLSIANDIWYICLLESYFIKIKCGLSTLVEVFPPHEEYDITFALGRAYSFVIKGNELIIYFPKIEDKNLLSYCTVIENKNLIIFKKR